MQTTAPRIVTALLATVALALLAPWGAAQAQFGATRQVCDKILSQAKSML